MFRPKTKKQLEMLAEKNFEVLISLLKKIPPNRYEESDVCEIWSIKDIVAHLYAWQELFLNWYAKGMAGKKPLMPAPGFNWKDTPKLNEKIYRDYKNVSFDVVMRKLANSHKKLQGIIAQHTEKELFTKKRYDWTGTTSLASYLIASSSSHCQWASDLILRWVKKQKMFE